MILGRLNHFHNCQCVSGLKLDFQWKICMDFKDRWMKSVFTVQDTRTQSNQKVSKRVQLLESVLSTSIMTYLPQKVYEK